MAKLVCHAYENEFKRDRKNTVQHFVNKGYWRRTINRVLARYVERGSIDYKKSSGHPVTVAKKKVVKTVDNLFKTNPNISTRAAAKKAGLTKSTLWNIKAKRLGLKTYKAKTAPKYNERQKKIAKTNCRKIVDKLLRPDPSKILVLDDETYIVVDPESVNGVKYYSCRDKKTVAPEYKFKGKEKFPKKYLVWLALNENGHVSKPLIIAKTLNSKSYLSECIKKRLIPFIENKNVLFWPDMATCHYAKNVTSFLKEKKVKFVQKCENAPNVPQARPIEKFWALLKHKYSKVKKTPKDLAAFKRIITKLMKEVAEGVKRPPQQENK